MPNENEQILIDQQLPLADRGGIYGHDPHSKTQNGLFALLPFPQKMSDGWIFTFMGVFLQLKVLQRSMEDP